LITVSASALDLLKKFNKVNDHNQRRLAVPGADDSSASVVTSSKEVWPTWRS